MSRVVLTALGYAFLLLGVLGLFLPFLQGALFIIVGLLLLSRHSPWAHRLLERFKARHPAARRVVEEAEKLSRRAIYRLRVALRQFARMVRG